MMEEATAESRTSSARVVQCPQQILLLVLQVRSVQDEPPGLGPCPCTAPGSSGTALQFALHLCPSSPGLQDVKGAGAASVSWTNTRRGRIDL